MLKELSVKILISNKQVPFFSKAFFLPVILSTILSGMIFFTVTSSVYAQEPEKKKSEALHVVSDKMVAQQDNSMVEFMGNVKVTRVDSVLLADSVKIYFNESNDKTTTKDKTAKSQTSDKTAKTANAAQSNVKKIVSTGNVEFTEGERKAFADKLVYTTKDEVLVLTGKAPRLVTGTSFVTGKKITLYRLDNKVIVESDGSNRVEALFNPEDNITEKP
jgi:lipopolysaccharide export system protein LptA